MTFERFQGTRQWADDLAATFQDDALLGAKGWIYGTLCIEDTSYWPSNSPGSGKGKWYPRIGNQEYQSDALEECERPLYEFSEPEGL